MWQNGNWLVPTFDGNPDMWNTKPPLMIWLQRIGLSVFGVGELAIRLPSAVAAILTCLLLLLFSKRITGDYLLGIIAVGVLITAQGYIHTHGTRTGDYDALLTLFTTAYLVAFYGYGATGKMRYFAYGCLSVALSVYTKSIQGLLFLPFVILYLFFWKKRGLELVKNKWTYLCILAAVGGVALYYGLREYYNPGYLQAVWENELGGRYNTILEEHSGGFNWYFLNLWNERFTYWLWLLPIAWVIGYAQKDDRLRDLAIFFGINTLGYGWIISSAATKLLWYDTPLFPLFAISIAIAFYWAFMQLQDSTEWHQRLRLRVLPYLLLAYFFIPAYSQIIQKVYLPQEKNYNQQPEFYELSYFLQHYAKQKNSPLRGKKVIYEVYHPHLNLYVTQAHLLGQPFMITGFKQVKAGDTLLVHRQHWNEITQKNIPVSLVKEYPKYSVQEVVVLPDSLKRLD